jgi:hypothetical protein
VPLADESVEVPREDQEDRPAHEVGRPDEIPIRVREREVGSRVACFDRHV